MKPVCTLHGPFHRFTTTVSIPDETTGEATERTVDVSWPAENLQTCSPPLGLSNGPGGHALYHAAHTPAK